MDLEFYKTTDAWSLGCRSSHGQFSFSGSFNQGRITAATVAKQGSRVRFFILGVIGILGLIAGVIGFWTRLNSSGELDAFGHSFYYLIFWLSVLADCYLWALYKQNHLREETLSVFAILQKDSTAKPVDVYNLFDSKTKITWDMSLAKAKNHGRSFPVLSDIVESLVEDSRVLTLLYRLGIPVSQIAQSLVSQGQVEEVLPTDTLNILEIPYLGLEESFTLRNKSVDALMLFCAILKELPENHPLRAMLEKQDVSLEKIEIVASWVFEVHMLSEELKDFRKTSHLRSDNEINKGLTAVPTKYLDQFSQDLTISAKYGKLPVAVGREPDLEKLFTFLSEGRRNLLISGQLGTGRSTLVHELAYRMVTETVPPLLQDKRLIKLEVSSIIGSQLPAEQVLIQALSEAERSDNIVLVLEDMHVLGKAQTSQGLSLLEILTNHLQSSNLVVIGTTTPNDYQDYLKNTLSFDELFTVYELEDLPRRGVLLASCIKASLLEGQNNVFFLYQAIEAAVDLSDRYIQGGGQPQKTIGILTEVATKLKSKGGDGQLVTAEIIGQHVSEKTHIPTDTFNQKEADKLLSLESDLAKYIIGQKEAVHAVSEALRRARTGLQSGSRPLGSFMFVGPTGVGKTELAKTLTKVYFGDQEYLLRLDMSEYRGGDGLQKLLGSKDDTINSPFVNHLKNHPFCLFLLDEFEKASPEILNLFLQILEDGRLTTGKGETLNLTHTIIIATSNAGTSEIQAGLTSGKALEEIKKTLSADILQKHFAPELLNRFDGIILFTPLSPDEVSQITVLQLQGLANQLLDNKGLKLSWTETAVSDIAIKGYDAALGARPIRRYVQDNVQNLLAQLILTSNPSRGTTITLDVENDALVLR